MKNLKLIPALLFAFTLCLNFLFAQEKDSNIDELRTPASPGFILMDEAPASVEKPSTPQGLAFNLLNLRQGGAIEVSPYWLKSHLELDFDTYVKEQFPILKTASISISTATKNDTLTIGAGFRTHLFRWRSTKNISAIAKIKSKIVNEVDGPLNDDDPDVTKIKKLSQELDSVMRPTILVELAGAYLGQSSNGSYDSLKKSRIGVWINISYKPCVSQPFEILFVERYLENPSFKEYAINSKILDTGVRLLYTFNRLGISAEYVQRKVIDNASFDRLAGIIEYKLNGNLYATATFGRNFNKDRDIIALFGINIGFSAKTGVK